MRILQTCALIISALATTQLAATENDCGTADIKGNAEARIFRASDCIDSGSVEGADLISLYRARAQAHYELKQYEAAISDAQKIIQLDPKDAQTFRSLGNVYFAQKKYELAVESYSNAIQIDPNSGLHYFARGTAYLALKRFDQAIEDLDQSIRLKPVFGPAYTARGTAYGAVRDTKTLLETSPGQFGSTLVILTPS